MGTMPPPDDAFSADDASRHPDPDAPLSLDAPTLPDAPGLPPASGAAWGAQPQFDQAPQARQDDATADSDIGSHDQTIADGQGVAGAAQWGPLAPGAHSGQGRGAAERMPRQRAVAMANRGKRWLVGVSATAFCVLVGLVIGNTVGVTARASGTTGTSTPSSPANAGASQQPTTVPSKHDQGDDDKNDDGGGFFGGQQQGGSNLSPSSSQPPMGGSNVS